MYGERRLLKTRTRELTKPRGQTSLDEGKEDNKTKDDGVTTLDMGFLHVSFMV
jgi:hypothetical protein